MELSGSSIKKFPIFSYILGSRNPEKIPYISGNGNPKKLLIFREMELFSPTSKNRKFLQKISHAQGKWNFLILILKNFLYFLKRKLFSYFRKRKTPKKFLIFQETELSHISGKETFLYFGKVCSEPFFGNVMKYEINE